MHMIMYRSYIDKIHCLFSLPSSEPQKKIIIACSGLPGQPENYELFSYFTQEGFICVHPKYEGTWESYGKFLNHSPVDDILKVIDHLKKERSLVSAYDNSLIKFDFDEVILFGSSFGGSVALVSAARSQNVNRAIAIAPVIDFSTQGKDKREEQDLTNLGEFLQRGYGRAYDFELRDWKKLLEGKIDMNPIKYIKELSPKKLFLVHGEEDKTISVYKTRRFFDDLKNKESEFLLVPNAGHLSFYGLQTTSSLSKILDWIKMGSK
ncbi:MAG: Uncharacterized protein G01um101416_576 [Microgenomates group bacterium Gr01-1014_16]|nr:MAG: Uncharacterized protein G01um101416_576 [Microgenomates group bacterium Gr01-1014_16]